MIVNDKTKELLIVPMKCGSTSFRKLYAKDKDWFDFSSNKQLDRLPFVGVEKIHEMFRITKRDIKNTELDDSDNPITIKLYYRNSDITGQGNPSHKLSSNTHKIRVIVHKLHI